jgi:hypothetical protein
MGVQHDADLALAMLNADPDEVHVSAHPMGLLLLDGEDQDVALVGQAGPPPTFLDGGAGLLAGGRGPVGEPHDGRD